MKFRCVKGPEGTSDPQGKGLETRFLGLLGSERTCCSTNRLGNSRMTSKTDSKRRFKNSRTRTEFGTAVAGPIRAVVGDSEWPTHRRYP
jgi:hypothetical protein